jgi:hypothetical protein
VLDLGAGTGWLSAFLSSFPNVEQIDTLDSDRNNLEVMLPQIIERMEGDTSKIHPILGLFSPLLVPDQQYGLIVASSSILFCLQYWLNSVSSKLILNFLSSIYSLE